MDLTRTLWEVLSGYADTRAKEVQKLLLLPVLSGIPKNSVRRISPREEDVGKPGLCVVVVAGVLFAGFPTNRANAMPITLAQATSIVDAALKKARELKQLPQTVVVLDAGGHLVAAKREDGSGIIRFEVAVGKAYGALGMGWGSRTMMERAAQNPNFLTSIAAASDGRVVPAPGGVLIRDGDGAVIGAVGISGDAGENDEVSAVAGIEAAGLKADPGGT
jgi:uncharacterized protein GlcG (DUF336 family)